MSSTDLHDAIEEIVSAPPESGRYPVVRTKRTADRAPINPTVRELVHLRDGNRCVFCGATGRLVLDHILPWSAGGTEDTRNMRSLCWDCNGQRSNYVTNSDRMRPGIVAHCLYCQRQGLEGFDATLETWRPVEQRSSDLRVWCARCEDFGPGYENEILSAAVDYFDDYSPRERFEIECYVTQATNDFEGSFRTAEAIKARAGITGEDVSWIDQQVSDAMARLTRLWNTTSVLPQNVAMRDGAELCRAAIATAARVRALAAGSARRSQ